MTRTLKSRAEKLQEVVIKLYESLHGHLQTPRLRQDDLERIEECLLATIDGAFEEAAKWCDENGDNYSSDSQAKSIREMKSGGAT